MSAIPAVLRPLGDTGESIWDSVWSQAHWLSDSDGAVMQRYCELWDEYAEACAELDESGRLMEGSKGQMVPSGFISMKLNIDNALRQHEKLLGLNPLARKQLNVPAIDVDDFADFIDDLQRA